MRSKNPRRRFLRQLETWSRNNCGRKLGFASMINNEVIDFAEACSESACCAGFSPGLGCRRRGFSAMALQPRSTCEWWSWRQRSWTGDRATV